MSVSIERTGIADHIVARLEQEIETVQTHFAAPDRIPSCQVKDLLPPELARKIFARFPTSNQMMLKRSIKEHKHVAAQMDAYDPLLEEAIYAFQDPRVVALISKITGFKGLEPDFDLYAGGISAMSKGAYLRPHPDNSHDKNHKRYRVVNLLYYVTPNWRENYGGCLQLWDDGPLAPSQQPRIMAAGKDSWPSVNEVSHAGARCCVSNYYFSRQSQEDSDYFHATSFRCEPKQVVLDLAMRADNVFRTTVLRLIGRVYKNPHVYKRGENRMQSDTTTP